MENALQAFLKSRVRIVLMVIALAGLMIVFLFQQVDILRWLDIQTHPYIHFSVKKTWRLILNDTFMLLVIHAWFYNRSVTQFAWKLQMLDTLLLLPLYLFLKLTLEGDSELSSPLLSQLHRLIINPVLMILVIPAVYVQQFTKKTKPD
jgi:exosortase F-associated protein